MIIHDVPQGSTAWLRLRMGVPTASSFDSIVTPTGKPSASAERYMLNLLAERLMDHPLEEHVSLWMSRGSELETEAVSFYELQKDTDTVPVGFVTNDNGTIGASPDRLVGDDGLLEIKVPSPYIHLGYLLTTGGAYKNYKPQVQGQLWITGRRWCDILSWHPELPPALHRVDRDEPFIATISAAVEAFSVQLENLYISVIERGLVKPREDEPLRDKSVVQMMKESLIEMNKA